MKTKLLILIMVMMHQNMFSQTLAEKDSKYLSLLERFNFPLMGAVFELKDFRDVKGTFSINASLYEFLDAFKSQTGISVEVHSKLKTDNKFVQALDFDNYWRNSSGNEEAPTFYVNAIAEIAKELDDGRYEYFIQLTILPNDNLSGSHLLHGDKFIAMTTYLTDSVPRTTSYLSSMYLNIFVENALRKYADVRVIKQSLKPKPGDPLTDMMVQGTDPNNLNNRIGGMYGCMRYVRDIAKQNCAIWKQNIIGFPDKPGKNKVHDGMDFTAATNTPVYAMFEGIATAGYSQTLGYYVRIESNTSQHGLSNEKNNTLIISYGHLSSYVNNLKNVKQGDLIGYTGNTGNIAANIGKWQYHLHLTVYRNNLNKYSRINPQNIITTKFDNNGNKIN